MNRSKNAYLQVAALRAEGPGYATRNCLQAETYSFTGSMCGRWKAITVLLRT